MAMWSVYIVKCQDGSYYTGITNNLAHRIADHNAGKGAKYTRRKKPVKLVYTEGLPNKSRASKREIQIKDMSRAKKEELMGLR